MDRSRRGLGRRKPSSRGLCEQNNDQEQVVSAEEEFKSGSSERRNNFRELQLLIKSNSTRGLLSDKDLDMSNSHSNSRRGLQRTTLNKDRHVSSQHQPSIAENPGNGSKYSGNKNEMDRSHRPPVHGRGSSERELSTSRHELSNSKHESGSSRHEVMDSSQRILLSVKQRINSQRPISDIETGNSRRYTSEIDRSRGALPDKDHGDNQNSLDMLLGPFQLEQDTNKGISNKVENIKLASGSGSYLSKIASEKTKHGLDASESAMGKSKRGTHITEKEPSTENEYRREKSRRGGRMVDTENIKSDSEHSIEKEMGKSKRGIIATLLDSSKNDMGKSKRGSRSVAKENIEKFSKHENEREKSKRGDGNPKTKSGSSNVDRYMTESDWEGLHEKDMNRIRKGLLSGIQTALAEKMNQTSSDLGVSSDMLLGSFSQGTNTSTSGARTVNKKKVQQGLEDSMEKEIDASQLETNKGTSRKDNKRGKRAAEKDMSKKGHHDQSGKVDDEKSSSSTNDDESETSESEQDPVDKSNAREGKNRGKRMGFLDKFMDKSKKQSVPTATSSVITGSVAHDDTVSSHQGLPSDFSLLTFDVQPDVVFSPVFDIQPPVIFAVEPSNLNDKDSSNSNLDDSSKEKKLKKSNKSKRGKRTILNDNCDNACNQKLTFQ